MVRASFLLVLGACLVAGSLATSAARAQGNPPGTVTASVAVGGVQQPAGEFERGGDVRWSSATLTGGVTRQFVPAFAAGLSLRYDCEDWCIGAPAEFGAKPPWRHLLRPGATLNLSLALSRTLVVGVSPTVEWACDSRANARDARICGGAISAARVFSPRFTLGAGASVTRQFYSLKTTPFVIVKWKLTDQVRIANAPATGPLGGAGVELRYAPTADWELAVGGVWRSDRWRLQDAGPAQGRIGETSFVPLLARLSRRLGAKARFDLYAGVSACNRLTVRDEAGNELARASYGAVPLVSATLSGRF